MALLFHNSNNNQQPGSDFVFKKINIFICSKSGGHWAFHNVQCLVVIFLNKNVSFSVSSMLERSYAKSETIEAIHRRITICQSKHKCFGPRSLLSACLSYYFLLKKKQQKFKFFGDGRKWFGRVLRSVYSGRIEADGLKDDV